MAQKNNSYSFDISIEEVNSILSKHPQKNQISYEYLLPIVEEKKAEFISRMISRIFVKRIEEVTKVEENKNFKHTAHPELCLKGTVLYDNGSNNKPTNNEEVTEKSVTSSLFML